MGTRLSFYKINPPYSHLKEVIFENFECFRNWYLEYPDEINTNIFEYIENENLFINNFNILDQRIVDEITSCFLGLFDNSMGAFFKYCGPDVRPIHYINSTNLIMKTGDEMLIEFWNIMINGRSIKNGKYHNGYDNDFKVGYLSKIECNKMSEKMKKYFIDIENIIKITGGKKLGIECILQLFNDIENYKNELVISVG